MTSNLYHNLKLAVITKQGHAAYKYWLYDFRMRSYLAGGPDAYRWLHRLVTLQQNAAAEYLAAREMYGIEEKDYDFG